MRWLGLFAIAACSSSATKSTTPTVIVQEEPQKTRVESRASRPSAAEGLLAPFAARDGFSDIRPAVEWTEIPELHEEASIEWGNKVLEEYVIVISEARAEFDADLDVEGFAKIHIERMDKVLVNMEVGEPKRIVLNGNAALQYEVTGSVDEVRVRYLIDYVQGRQAFHQVLIWTLSDQFAQKREKFHTVMRTFRGK